MSKVMKHICHHLFFFDQFHCHRLTHILNIENENEGMKRILLPHIADIDMIFQAKFLSLCSNITIPIYSFLCTKQLES